MLLVAVLAATGCRDGGQGVPAAFCGQMARASGELAGLDARAFTDPAHIRAARDRLRAVTQAAPEEVRADARLVAQDLDRLLVYVESAGKDVAQGAFDFDRFGRALRRVQAYAERTCPPVTTSTTASSPVPTTGGGAIGFLPGR